MSNLEDRRNWYWRPPRPRPIMSRRIRLGAFDVLFTHPICRLISRVERSPITKRQARQYDWVSYREQKGRLPFIFLRRWRLRDVGPLAHWNDRKSGRYGAWPEVYPARVNWKPRKRGVKA